MPRSPRKEEYGKTCIERHISLPCGKIFSGMPNTVAKLVNMHARKCNICNYKNIENFNTHTGKIDRGLDCHSHVRKKIANDKSAIVSEDKII